jgi:hypothetical protein
VSPEADELQQRIAAALRIQLGREATPEEFAAALALQRNSLAEYTSPSAARIKATEDANKPNGAAPTFSRSELSVGDSLHFDDCKAPTQWTEPPRPKRNVTAQEINATNRAAWKLAQEVMAADQAEFEKSLAATRAAAEVRVGKAVSDFQAPRSRLLRPKKEPTQRSEAIAAMIPWRANNHTRADFLAAAEVDSIPGVSIKLAPLVDGNKYIVDCENTKDEPKTVDLETIKRWWKKAAKTI